MLEKFKLEKDCFLAALHNENVSLVEELYRFEKYCEVMNSPYALQKHSFPRQEVNTTNIYQFLTRGLYPPELRSSILRLTNYVKENLGIEYLEICARNLSHLTLVNLPKIDSSEAKEKINSNLDEGVLGEYDSEDNIMTIYHRSSKDHEIMHMASSPYTNAIIETTPEITTTGFVTKIPCYQRGRKNKRKFSFGVGFNEGCTEMFAQRIYEDENYNTDCYTIPVQIVRMIELLYDNPNDMLKDYLTGNPIGPYKQFTKYACDEDYYCLLILCDQLKDYTKVTATQALDAENEAITIIEEAVERTNNLQKMNDLYNLVTEYYLIKYEQGIDFEKECIKEDENLEENYYDNTEEFIYDEKKLILSH